MIRQILWLFCLLFSAPILMAQEWNGTSLFRPRVSLGYEAMPTVALNDSVQFRSNDAQLSGLIPLRVSVSAKKLKPKVKVDMLSFNIGRRFAELEGFENYVNIGRASVGWTGIRAGLGSGMWVYLVQAGTTVPSAQRAEHLPYLTAGFGRIIVRGLKRQTVVGAGIYAARNLVLPFPIVGFHRILNTKSGIITVLPVYISYWYSPADKLKFSATASFGGFNGAVFPTIPSGLVNMGLGPDGLAMRVGYLRAGARFEWRPFSSLWFSMEGGSDCFKKVSFVEDREVVYTNRIPFQPYLKGGITYKIPRKDDKIPWPEF